MKSNTIRFMACDLIFTTKNRKHACRYVILYLIQFCVRSNYLQPILYRIKLYNTMFLAATLLRCYFRDVADTRYSQ